MRIFIAALLAFSPYAFAVTDLGTQPTTACVEAPCTTYRFPPHCIDANYDGVCDGYSLKTWTAGSAITSVPAACNAGADATATPDIHPVFTWTGNPAGLSISSTTGAITGTPTTEGSGTISVTCKNDLDSTGITIDLAYVINESPSVPASGYFVKKTNNGTACSDSNTGLSNAQAWCTLSKVASTVTAAGAKVYLLDGDTWTSETLTVDWAGTASDHSVLGSYYMNAGVETVGKQTANGPKITGTYNYSCSVTLGGTGQCPFEGVPTTAVPNSRYNGMITLAASYVDVQDLWIYGSSGRCITDNGTAIHDLKIQRNYLELCAGAGAILLSNATDSLVLSNTSTDAGVAGSRADARWTDRPFAIGVADTYDPIPSRILFIGNTVIRSHGEGMGDYRRGNTVFRANTIYGAENVGIYIEGTSHDIIEQNTVYCWDSNNPTGHCSAISIGTEYHAGTSPLYPSTTDIVIRNNRIANSSTCLQFVMAGTVITNGAKLSGIDYLGNTCLGWTTYGFDNAASTAPTSSWINNIRVKGNVFAQPNGGSGCRGIVPTLFTFDYNGVESAWNDTDCSGSHDIVASAGITTSINWSIAGVTAYPNNTPTVSPSDANWNLGASSTMLNASTPMTDSISTLVNSQYADYVSGTASTLPCSGTDATLLTKDYSCTTRNATTPDMGVLEQ